MKKLMVAVALASAMGAFAAAGEGGAPEIELSAVAADIASAAGQINVKSTGASVADLYVVYGHDGFVYTNKVATAEEPGVYDYMLPNLKPATAYTLYAFAENGREGGFAQTDPIAFETAAEKLRDESLVLPDGYTRLECVTADGSQYVLPGVRPTGKTTFTITFSVPSVSAGNNQGLMGGMWNWGGTWLFQNRNGEIRFNLDESLVTVEKNEVYTFAIDQSAAYTFTHDGAIVASGTSSIAYKQGAGIALFASDVSGISKSMMSVYAFTLWEEGGKIRDFVPCKDANGVACLYDLVSRGPFRSQTSTALIAGAEVVEYPRSVLPTESFVYDGKQLAATITRTGTRASDVCVCLGATYGGCETNGWENVVRTGAAFGEGESSVTVAAVVPDGTRYVRLFSEKDGWSETFFIDELEASDSAKVGLTAPVVVETKVAEAAFSVGLTWLGTGATAVDLYAVYGHDGFVYTNKITTADAPGAYAFTLPNLKPGTAYTLSVYAENGCEGGFAQTEAIAFETAAEAFQDEIIVLPAGYTRLESVASTGEQWVDTEVVPTSKGNYSIVMDFLPVSVAGDVAYFGVAVKWNGSWLFQRHSKLGFRFDGGSEGVQVPVVVDARQRLTIDGNGALVENLDTGVAADPVTSIFRGDAIGGKSIGLFAVNGGEWATSFTLYRFKVFADGETVRDFVPCKDANGVACLYDLVLEKPFYSESAKALVAGPVAEDVDAAELEIESVTYAGRRLTAKLQRKGGEAGDIYACYGSSYGGFGTNGWESVAKIGAFQADETFVRCGFELPKTARYVRFFSEVGGWSKTVFLPEMPNRGGLIIFFW